MLYLPFKDAEQSGPLTNSELAAKYGNNKTVPKQVREFAYEVIEKGCFKDEGDGRFLTFAGLIRDYVYRDLAEQLRPHDGISSSQPLATAVTFWCARIDVGKSEGTNAFKQLSE